MSWFADDPPPARIGTHHVQIFIPSLDRDGNAISKGQEYWVEEGIEVLTTLFGGATAFPPARGAWRDDETGELLYDNTVIIFSYAADGDMTAEAAQNLRKFLMWLGRETNQGEVGIYADGTYRGFQNFDAVEDGDA